MTPDDEKPPASTPPDREPPTLELTAGEVQPASDTAAEPSPSEPWADTASDPLRAEQAHSEELHAGEAHAAREASGQPPREEPPPFEPAAAPPPRVSWLPGGWLLLVAATAGAGIVLAAVWAANLWLMPDNGVSEVDARLAALELQLRDLASSIPAAPDGATADDISNRLAKLEAAGNPAAALGDPTLGDRLGALQTELKALSETVAMLGRRSDEALAAAREARARADAAVAQLGPLSQKVAAAPVVDRNEVEALRSRIVALEQNDKTLEGELAKRAAADSGDRAVKLALAATALKSAVERGDPFVAELATAKALVPDPKLLAPLEPFAAAGVPTAAALGRELADLAPALRASVAAPRESFLQRLQGNAEKLVRIRPAEEVAGNDTSAIVRRIEVKAANGDLNGALAELAQLPPPVRAPADAWIKKAQARAAAVESSRRLAADALAGLGK